MRTGLKRDWAFDGGRIWYRVFGSGTATPVVLLHGGPGYHS